MVCQSPIGTPSLIPAEQWRRSRLRAETSGRLQAVTLARIGDAVITTDTGGCVTILNTGAERLASWPNREAAGQPLASLFRIVNQQTRQPVGDPTHKVLR